MSDRYSFSVFLNVPFDRAFWPLLEAIVFATIDCGFSPRCALEISDSSLNRLDKIYKMIRECRHGIHDLSRTELDPKTRLPRFNMPLELGIFLGAKRFGVGPQKRKSCLILDREPFRYRVVCSDISGQDLHSHRGKASRVIEGVRDWLDSVPSARGVRLHGAHSMAERFKKFERGLPRACRRLRLRRDQLTFRDLVRLATAWVKKNP